MYNILKRQYNYFIRGVIRINEEVQRELDLLVQKIRETVSSVQKIILLALMHMAHQMKTVILISVLLWKVSEKEKEKSLIVSIGVFMMLWKHQLIF